MRLDPLKADALQIIERPEQVHFAEGQARELVL
jgi:hypothetical protein